MENLEIQSSENNRIIQQMSLDNAKAGMLCA
jgi:hypothetical protein